MGIRVHKVMGYGLRKCKFGKDPRFNSHVFGNEQENMDGDLRPKLISYVDTLISRENDSHHLSNLKIEKCALECKGLFEHSPSGPLYSYDIIKYNYFNDEGDLPIGPIVFTIPYHKDWYRFDDSIDYHEESQRYMDRDGTCDRVNVITDCEGQLSGIYPYNGSYVHRTDGNPVKGYTSDRWIITKMFREHNTTIFKENNDWNVKSFIEWQRHIVPKVPLFIQLFCDCFQIFKNPSMKFRLCPMVFTYWC